MSPRLLTLEACQLGDEAIRCAFKANAMSLDDPRRWNLTRRMLEINHRLRQITAELHSEDLPNEDRIVS